MRTLLGLGNAQGCRSLYTVADPSEDIDDTINDALTNGQIGKELRAICGRSQVGSASSVGGSVNTIQATKTVSQFQTPRKRIDSRTKKPPPSKRTGMNGSYQLAALSDPEIMSDAPPGYFGSADEDPGIGFFGSFQYESRDRDTTDREDGFEANISGATVGLDFANGDFIFGLWADYSELDGDFNSGSPIVGGPTAEDVGQLAEALAQPGAASTVCGGATPGGSFNTDGKGIGGFIAYVDPNYFADLQLSYRDYDQGYRRNTCAIEGPSGTGALLYDPGTGTIFSDTNENNGFDAGDKIADDIYAGVITGSTKVVEAAASLRVGTTWSWDALSVSPQSTLSYVRTETDGYTETGRSSVFNTITGNDNYVTTRDSGDPIGLELVYADRTQESLKLEVGAEVGYAIETGIGTLTPYASAFWRHEFNDDAQIGTARFAQDLRANPLWFDYSLDSPTKDTGLFAVGVTLAATDNATFQIEARQLAFDDYLSATSVTAQARLRF